MKIKDKASRKSILSLKSGKNQIKILIWLKNKKIKVQCKKSIFVS